MTRKALLVVVSGNAVVEEVPKGEAVVVVEVVGLGVGRGEVEGLGVVEGVGLGVEGVGEGVEDELKENISEILQ